MNITTVWSWGTQWWFHPCLQYTRFLPIPKACPYRKQMSIFDATWMTALPSPCLVCSKPHKLPSIIPNLFLHIGIARSCTAHRSNRNCTTLAVCPGPQPRLAAKSSFRIFFMIYDVPFFEQWVSYEVTECHWLDWLVLLKCVQVDLLLH